jgi:hypothetical protein
MPRNTGRKRFAFAPTFRAAKEAVLDKDLAKLGDAYTNFVYSLFLSERAGGSAGGKVSGHVLSEALKRAGLRDLLPLRADRHEQADAAEALLVYAWLQGSATITEHVEILVKKKDSIDAFTSLLSQVKDTLRL